MTLVSLLMPYLKIELENIMTMQNGVILKVRKQTEDVCSTCRQTT